MYSIYVPEYFTLYGKYISEPIKFSVKKNTPFPLLWVYPIIPPKERKYFFGSNQNKNVEILLLH
jgi:hypothetical protein